MLRLLRFARLVKAAVVLSRTAGFVFGIRRGITRKILQLTLQLLMVAHVMSCIWFLAARAIGFGGDDAMCTAVLSAAAGVNGTAASSSSCIAQTWISKYGLGQTPDYYRYIYFVRILLTI